MKATARLVLLTTLLLGALVLSACGSQPVTIDEIPAFPNSTALQPGESTLADTLAQNTSQDAAIREAAGVGGSTVQKGFSVPADTTWEDVTSFYNTELKAKGWAEGMGGPGGSIAAEVMSQVNESNELFQTASYSKDKQILTVMRLADPVDTSKVELLFSLTTN